MSETEKKPRKRQPKQTNAPALVERTETSGVDLIYPPSLVIGEQTDLHIKTKDDLLLTTQEDNTIIALVPDNKEDKNIPSTVSEPTKESTYKMDTLTQIYVGSLTVVGLFVVYRLIMRKQ